MTSIPELSARGSLILWAKCQIPVGPRPCVGPKSGRKGEKCRPLDHLRHIPFIHQLCSHPTLRSISVYIQNCFSHFFHVVYTLWLETLYICHLRMLFPNHLLQGSAPSFWNHFALCVVRISTRYSHTLPLKLDTDESLIAPCYPRTNDQAERLVQNGEQLLRRKEAFQSSKVLVRCLFSYKTTPNSTTYTNCSANK